MKKDILGTALLDYQKGNYSEDIVTYSSLDEEDIMPLPYLFRSFKEMPLLEKKALQLCKGHILDIGAGAGAHSLHLQQQNKNVTALEISKGAADVLKQRGIKQVLHEDIYQLQGPKFDTLLILMNGIGIVGTLARISDFFAHAKTLLQPNGQILIDSSDIIYMFEADDDGGYWIPDNNTYYGEVTFTMSYKGQKGTPFSWLYIDYNTLQRSAIANGFDCELIQEGEHFDYLAKLTLASQ